MARQPACRWRSAAPCMWCPETCSRLRGAVTAGYCSSTGSSQQRHLMPELTLYFILLAGLVSVFLCGVFVEVHEARRNPDTE